MGKNWFSDIEITDYETKSGEELIQIWLKMAEREISAWSVSQACDEDEDADLEDYHTNLDPSNKSIPVYTFAELQANRDRADSTLYFTRVVALHLKRKFKHDFLILFDFWYAFYHKNNLAEVVCLFEKINHLIIDVDLPFPDINQTQIKILGRTKESQQINEMILILSKEKLSDQVIKNEIDKKFPDADISLENIRTKRSKLKKHGLL